MTKEKIRNSKRFVGVPEELEFVGTMDEIEIEIEIVEEQEEVVI